MPQSFSDFLQQQQVVPATAPAPKQSFGDFLQQQGPANSTASTQQPGFFESAYNASIGALVSGIREFMNRPDEIRKATDALGVYQKIEDDSGNLPENKGKPPSQWKLREATPDEQKIIDAGMNANLAGPETDIMGQNAAPAIAATQQAQQGNFRGAAGTLVGGYGPLVAGPKISQIAPEIRITPRLSSSLDPAETAAVQFAQQRNIPVDAATATGNPAVRSVQAFLEKAPGSAGYMKKAAQARTEALRQTGKGLLTEISPAETSPEIAGTGVVEALQSRRASQATSAAAEYDRLRQIENHPNNIQTVTVGTKPSGVLDASGNPIQTPITKEIALPVDMRPIKQALGPIADQLRRQITPGQQQYSKALLAIQNVLSGDDLVPASVADQNLSALKAIQREAPNAKTQWLATQIIKQYAPAVDAAVAQAGPAATDALRQGRQLTAAKYATEGTLFDRLPVTKAESGSQPVYEPVQVFNKLTAAKDANVNLVRDVASKTPEALPSLRRAVVEGLMDKAFAEAGTAKPGTALTEWQKLGPQTKAALQFDGQTLRNLDNFFVFAKKAAENPNPSGTATTAQVAADGALLWNAPHLGVSYIIGKNALARLLTNPTTARAVINGLTLPTNRAAMATVLTHQVLQTAGPDAQQINAPSSVINANPLGAWGMQPQPAAAGSQ